VSKLKAKLSGLSRIVNEGTAMAGRTSVTP
jgi:hypothetical protein